MTQPATTDRLWQIASFVLQCQPERQGSLQQYFAQLVDITIDIIEKRDDGQLAIVAESSSPAAIRRLVDELQQLPGVLSTSLVYHEEVAEGSEPIQLQRE